MSQTLKVRNIDTGTVVSFGNQLWRLFSGPFTMVLIALLLSGVTQGYWYTFVSICALTIFADLGFTNIVLQFSAHEVRAMKVIGGKLIPNDPLDELAIKKLGTLYSFVQKWVSRTTLVIFPIIYLVGVYVFVQKSDPVDWFLPWILYVAGSALTFYNQTILSFLEGCNQVAKTQLIRLVGSIINVVTLLLVLSFHYGLYAIALATIVSSVASAVIIQVTYGKFIAYLKQYAKGFSYSWRQSILGLLWKYALSWSSGYFIFQIYVPLAFSRYGAEFAGKIGFTLSLIMAGFTVSTVWLTAAYPRLNGLFAEKKWKDADGLFDRRFALGLATYVFGFSGFLLFFVYFKDSIPVLYRFLPLLPMSILLIAWLFQYVVNGMAMYMRAHKEEPLVVLSVISSVIIGLSTLLLVYMGSSDWMFLGFLATQIVLFPFIFAKFTHYRTVRHEAGH